MADQKWQKVREIFDSALRRNPDERRKFVVEACMGDKALFSEVESLLASLDSADSFMETPAVAAVADAIEGNGHKLKRDQCLGHYRMIKVIGSGGMGEVYLARDQKLDRHVAVKLLHEKFSKDESNLGRFVREAKAASALNHPNILVIHEIGEAEGAHFIVSEYVEGDTLRTNCREKSLELSDVLDVSIQIAGALSTAHKAHLIHRDIKPENIMVRPDGYVKVLDFGLAKLIEPKNRSFLGLNDPIIGQTDTAKGVIMGTVNYMSPEQAKGEEVDQRTDIFSFGVVIYEMIAGTTPFAGDSMSETFANVINAQPRPLSHFAANVPDELERIISKTLSKNKAGRYQTMQDILTDLKDLRDNLTLDKKMERSSAAEGYETAILGAKTGDGNQQTANTHYSLIETIKQRRSLAAVASATLLAAAIGLGLYLFYPGKPALGADGKKSIAVLPLKPISTLGRDEIYEIGIAESLIHRISSMKGFIVRPLSATRHYDDVGQDPIAAGKEQKVDYVLASNYQLAGGRIRITAQLLDVISGQIEQTYKTEKDTADVFAAQDAIAGEVENILQARFATTSGGSAAKRGTSNEEAYRSYLQATNLTARRSASDAKLAIEYFEQAIRLDPNYAPAYAGMANAYIASGTLGGGLPREQNENARSAVTKALELDSTLAEAYAVRADLKFKYEWDFAGAEKDWQRAVELDANRFKWAKIRSTHLADLGRFDEAMAEVEAALEIDPNSLELQRDRGRFLYLARRYDEAIVQLTRVLEVDENFRTASGWLFRAYEMKGDYSGAYDSFIDRVKRIDPDNVEAFQTAYRSAGWQGVRRKQVELSKLEEHKPGANFYQMASQCAILNEREQAFEYLDKAIEKRQSQLVMLDVEPTFDNLRDDPRFDDMLRRVGLK